jgi:hypothetical protein
MGTGAPSSSFPIARRVWRLAMRVRANWLERHQVPANFWLHIVGIPVAFAGLPLLYLAGSWVGFAAITSGYFLQWVGHRVEGNDVGEMIPLKRLLGLPVIPIAPRFLPASPGPPDHPARQGEPIRPA